MAEHAPPISASEDREGPPEPRLEALDEVPDLRSLAAQVAAGARTRARARVERAQAQLGGAAPESLAPVVSLASRARATWRVLAVVRRNKTPIGVAVALVVLLALLGLRHRRRRRT